MAQFGPWDAARRVAVAVSGGPDSLALALLTKSWGDPVAFIVDHGLRPGSAAEARTVRRAMQARGIPADILTLHGLRHGPGLAARARDARYAALTAACRAAGLVDLLLGHHAGDQAETVLMRQRRGSGPAGLAGMAACVEHDDLRLLRPLLHTAPEALRALVLAAGLAPVDDPSNQDARATRTGLRREIGTSRGALLRQAAEEGRARRAADQARAVDLAAHAAIFPGGFAVVAPGPVGAGALGTLLRALSGRRYPVRAGALEAGLRPATVAGVQVLPAGRLGPGWLLVREAAAMAPERRWTPGAVWDGRFRARAPGAPALPPGLPHAVRRTLPPPDWEGRVQPAGLPAGGAAFVILIVDGDVSGGCGTMLG